MEHWMDCRPFGQCQAIGCVADLCCHSKGAEIFEQELVVGSGCHRSLNIRLQLEKHHIHYLKLAKCSVLVCLLLHDLLGTEQVLSQQIMDHTSFSKPGLKIGYRATVRCFDPPMTRLMAIEDNKW